MADLPALSGVALVTGAASGIGKSIAHSFAEAGCRGVVFADVNYDAATAAAEESRALATDPEYRAIAVKVDVADLKSVRDMVDKVVGGEGGLGRVDYGVNAAGIASLSTHSAVNTDFSQFNRIIDTNLKGTAYCIATLAKTMIAQDPLPLPLTCTPPSRRGQGKDSDDTISAVTSAVTPHTPAPDPNPAPRGVIINIGSVYSHLTRPSSLAYTSSKHGIIGLTKAAALDHARDGIRVNAVCPGATETPLFMSVLDKYPEMRKGVRRHVPWQGRMARPREVACAVLWLCGPGASYVTGVSLGVDGGVSLTHGGSKI